MSLNLKLNLSLSLLIVMLLVTMLVIVGTNVSNFFTTFERQQVQADLVFFEQRFAELENEIFSAVQSISNLPEISAQIENERLDALRVALLLQAAALGLDHVEIIAANREAVIMIAESQLEFADPSGHLVQLGLNGIQTTTLVFEGEQPYLAAVVPVRNAAAVVVGVIFAGRKLDAAFLDRLDYSVADRHISLLSSNGLLVTDTSSEGKEDWDAGIDAALVAAALRGETQFATIADEDGTPDFTAYSPLTIGGEIGLALYVRVGFETLFAFRTRLLTTVPIAILFIAIVAIVLAVIIIRTNITQPLRRVQTTADLIAKGDFKQRIQTRSRDEIGQVSQAFNSMTDQLQRTFTQLEERALEANAARERAEESDRVKSAFLASMSHELRTPLNSVINFAKLVRRGVMGPVTERQIDALDKVVGSGKHLLNLINDVLDISKIESGSLQLFIEKDIDVNSILTTVAATAESLLLDKPVTLQVKTQSNLPLIQGDRQRLLQVMLNMVSNACKFTDQGTIEITAALNQQEIIFSVRDTGPGIAEQDYEAVFTPFKQTDTGLRGATGTGLGMPISKNLAEAHGGRLWLTSVVGQGSTFYFAFPVRSPELVSEPVRTP